MKVRKYIGRDRKTAGLATGTVLCQLSLPAIEEEYGWRPFQGNPARIIEKIRHFIERRLPENPVLQKDASFVIQAEVRASSGALRRKRLAKWTFGNDLALVFKQASQAWATLELEEDYTTIEVEI